MTSKNATKAVKAPARQGQAFKDKSKPADIRQSNINAAKGKFCAIKIIFSFNYCIYVCINTVRVWDQEEWTKW